MVNCGTMAEYISRQLDMFEVSYELTGVYIWLLQACLDCETPVCWFCCICIGGVSWSIVKEIPLLDRIVAIYHLPWLSGCLPSVSGHLSLLPDHLPSVPGAPVTSSPIELPFGQLKFCLHHSVIRLISKFRLLLNKATKQIIMSQIFHFTLIYINFFLISDSVQLKKTENLNSGAFH